MGSIKVYWNTTLLTPTPISLASTSVLQKQLLTFPAFTAVQSVTLKIVVTTSAKPVVIDGAAKRVDSGGTEWN